MRQLSKWAPPVHDSNEEMQPSHSQRLSNMHQAKSPSPKSGQDAEDVTNYVPPSRSSNEVLAVHQVQHSLRNLEKNEELTDFPQYYPAAVINDACENESPGNEKQLSKSRRKRAPRTRGMPDEESFQTSQPSKMQPDNGIVDIENGENESTETRSEHERDAEVLPHAMPVQGEEQEQANGSRRSPIVIATKATLMNIDWKSKKGRICILVTILVVCGVIGGVVAAVLTTTNNSGNRSSNGSETLVNSTNVPQPTSLPEPISPTTSPTTAAPTMLVLEQLGDSLFDEGHGTLTGPRGERFFGWTVDMTNDGNRIAINLPYCPCVYIYDLVEGSWATTAIVSDGPGVIDHIALSGNGKILAMGIPRGAEEVDRTGGKIQLFQNSGSTWERLGQPFFGLSNADHLGGNFGDKAENYNDIYSDISRQSYDSRTMALSNDGHIFAFGSPRGNYVRVLQYDESSGRWITLGKQDFLLGQDGGDEFGASVDLSANGKRIVIGSPDNLGHAHPNFYIRNGQVRVYQYYDESDSWIKIGQDIKGARGNDLYGLQAGSSVSISSDGSVIAVASNLKAESEDLWHLGEDDGHAKVYRYSESRDEWMQIGQTINVFQFGLGFDPDNSFVQNLNAALNSDEFPINTRLSGDGTHMVISALAESLNSEFTGRGVVRLFELRGLVWEEVGQPIQGSQAYDHSGRSLAISFNGSRLVVGSPKHNGSGGDQGEVRVFDVNGKAQTPSPTPTKAPSIVAEPSGEQVALTVSLRCEGDKGWSLQCGDILLASEETGQDWLPKNITETFLVDLESTCYLRFADDDMHDVDYVVFYETEGGRTILLNESTYSYQFSEQFFHSFVVTDDVVSVTLAIQFDEFPNEIGLNLWCNDILYRDYQAGSFGNVGPGELISDLRVPGIKEGAECKFTIFDTFGDGLCCGDTYYEIYFGNDTQDKEGLLVRRNGRFGNSDSTTFVASANQALVTSSPTDPETLGPMLTMPPAQAPLTFTPTTPFPTGPPSSLVPITVVFEIHWDAKLFGWKLQCGHIVIAEHQNGTYTEPGVFNQTLYVEDGGQCVLILSSVEAVGSYEWASVSYSIYYGLDASNQEMLLAAGREFDEVHVLPFKVSPDEDPITPSPTYTTEQPSTSP